MENPTPFTGLKQNENLDIILQYYIDNAPKESFPARMDKIAQSFSLTGIMIRIDPNNTGLFKFLREKLVGDGLIERLPQPLGEDVPFIVTYQGYFYEGYVYQMNKMNEAADRITRLEQHQRALLLRTMWATIVIAVGTLISACYYAIEVWKFYFPHVAHWIGR